MEASEKGKVSRSGDWAFHPISIANFLDDSRQITQLIWLLSPMLIPASLTG